MEYPVEAPNLDVDSQPLEERRPSTNAGESLLASVGLALSDTSTSALIDMSDMGQKMSEGPELSSRELNEKFAGEGFKFQFPMTDSAARETLKRHRDRATLEDVVARGPDNFAMKATNFSAAMLLHALDPIDYIAGVGVGKIAKLAYAGAKLSRAGVVARGFAEQAVGNLAVEPLSMASATLEDREYTAAQAFANALGGAVMGTGLRFGVGAVVSRLSGRGWDGHLLKVQTEMAQLNSGRMADSSLIERDRLNEVAPVRRESGQAFTRVDPAADTPLRVFGAALSPEDAPRALVQIGDDFGDGYYLSTNRNAANGVGASKYSDAVGDVLEFQTPGRLNLIDLDAPMREDLGRLIPEFKDAPDARSALDNLKEAIQRGEVPEGRLNEINETLRAQGFDGYYHDNRVFGGETGREENVLMIFNPEKLSPIARTKADTKLVPQMPRAELQRIARQEAVRKDSPLEMNEKSIGPEAKELVQRNFEPNAGSKSDADFEIVSKEADALEKEGFLSAEETLSLRERAKSLDEVASGYESAFNCMVGGLL
jgi:hypothetical protein